MKLTVNELAMFLGCEVETKEGIGYMAEITHKSNCSDRVKVIFNDIITKDYQPITGGDQHTSNAHDYYIEADPVKPILRPISDMTGEEESEIGIMFETCNCSNPSNSCKDGYHEDIIVWSPESLKSAIEKQFDIFGWIEKGLAIDKTKI